MTAAISVRGLHYRYESATVLHDLSFDVPEGSILGLLGENGAGKTTALRVLAGLLPIQAGKVIIKGHDLAEEANAVREELGYLPEENARTPPGWTALRYLSFFATLYGLPLEGARLRVRQLLNEYQCPADSRLTELSYGQRRRLELCRCFVGQPSVVLMDEPTKGLDIPGKVQLWKALSAIRQRGGPAILLCSHDTQEIEILCTHVVVLRQGRTVFKGSMSELGGPVAQLRVHSPQAALAALSRRNVAAEPTGSDRIQVTLQSATQIAELLDLLREHGIEILDIRMASALGERLSGLMTAA